MIMMTFVACVCFQQGQTHTHKQYCPCCIGCIHNEQIYRFGHFDDDPHLSIENKSKTIRQNNKKK